MIIRRAVPQSDRVLSSSDYEAGELVSNAQNCIWTVGFSVMGDALNRGLKVHNLFGSSMLGMQYEQFNALLKDKYKPCVNARQSAKIGNFGFPGFAGAVRLVHQQRGQKPDTPCALGPTIIKDEVTGDKVPGYRGLRLCILMDGAPSCGERANGEPGKTHWWNDEPISPTCRHCIDCAVRLKKAWTKQWPEMSKYFDWVSDAHKRGMVITQQALDRWPWLKPFYQPGTRLKPAQVMLHFAGVLRGGLTAPSLANGQFQSLLAVAARRAYSVASRECYDTSVRVPDMRYANSVRSRYAGGPSPLLGSRVPAFLHDEILGDHARSIAHDAATRIGEVLVDELRYVCPDVAPAAKVEPCLMDSWIKGAEARWERGGKQRADEYDRLVSWQPDKKAA